MNFEQSGFEVLANWMSQNIPMFAFGLVCGVVFSAIVIGVKLIKLRREGLI